MKRRHLHAIGVLLAVAPLGAAFAQHAHESPRDTSDPSDPSECSAAHAAMGHCKPTRSPAAASEGAASAHEHVTRHDHRARVQTDASDTCTPEHAAKGHCTPHTPTEEAGARSCTRAHAAMGHCTPEPAARPREPIPPLTDADRAAAFPVLSHDGMAHGPTRYGRVVLQRLEGWNGDHGSSQAWEASASFGGDIHRLWLRAGGERSAGRTADSHVELHWSRAVARWWDVVAGVRQDIRPGPSRTRAALGVQGIAPWMLEVSAFAYFGEGGGVAAELEAEYDMRLSNRLILQPMLELELQSGDDPARHTGSGLSKAEAGLRLRYEVTRRLAPYLGLVHERSFGDTARHHEAAGAAARDTRLVVGVRGWF